MPADRPVDRRQFFRAGLRELLKPLVAAMEDPVKKVVRELNAIEAASGSLAPSRPVYLPLDLFLRPPGALPEAQFLNTCQRCQACLRACPAQCIKLDETGLWAGGAPHILPDQAACVVCEGLACMSSCASGALRPVCLDQIDMGTAIWRQETCGRSKGLGCTICIDQCPLGAAAIELRDGRVCVQEHGCIGCGICQHDCPTNPKSIMVVPARTR